MSRSLVCKALDDGVHLLMFARLRLHDWIAGPPPETPSDRAILDEGEQVRKAFPEIDFTNPTPRREAQR